MGPDVAVAFCEKAVPEDVGTAAFDESKALSSDLSEGDEMTGESVMRGVPRSGDAVRAGDRGTGDEMGDAVVAADGGQ